MNSSPAEMDSGQSSVTVTTRNSQAKPPPLTLPSRRSGL